MLIVRVLVFIAGMWLVGWTLLSAIRLVVLPRSTQLVFGRILYTPLHWLFRLRTRKAKTYEQRDRIMALYAPIALLLTPAAWMILVLIGYSAVFWAVSAMPVREAVILSGSSLLTLGFAIDDRLPQMMIIFTEAIIGLGLVALLISYLPTMYSAFSERERAVSMLEVRAGSPPSAVELLTRFHRISAERVFADALEELYRDWERWFAALEETHTSLTALIYFRSPEPHRSWITAAGAVLDSAALYMSIIRLNDFYQAALCVRAGYIALRRIADSLNIDYDPNPTPTDPISIAYDEFEAVYDQLAAQGLRVKEDKEQAWRDFRGWRVNYDTVLIELASVTMAPYAPWSSDRSLPKMKPKSRARVIGETLTRWRRRLTALGR